MTIICNSRRFIFVHLHKCGGTSVRHAIRTHIRWNDLLIGGNDNDNILEQIYRRRYALEKHNSAQQLQQIVGDELWQGYWTFSLVRHPASIVESFYYWIIKVIKNRSAKHGMPFAQMRELLQQGLLDDEIAQWGAAQAFCRSDDFAGYVRYAMQHNCLGFGQTLTQRLTDNNGKLVDSVFKLENTAAMISALHDRTGINIQLGHRNRSAQRQAPWTPALLELVYQRYQEDYENFDYAKHPD